MNDSKAYYGKVYQERFSGKVSEIPRGDYPRFCIDSLLSGDKKAGILDAGCGKGLYTKYLQNLGYENTFAVDLFETPLMDIQNYISSSIDELPFKDAEFDLVFCNSVIYHLENPMAALAEFKRVLKPGGKLFFTCHNKYSLFTLWRRCRVRTGRKKSRNLKGVVFRSAKAYNKMLAQLGLTILRQDGYSISFLLYPMYIRAAAIVEKYLKLRMPRKKPTFSPNRRIGRIKSELAYHMVFIVQKQPCSRI